MKLYNASVSPNAQRVRIFLAEKGLEVETQLLDLFQNEARSPEYLKINSLGAVPALVLDDGSVITESVAVCRYLDALHPEPPLFGADAKSQALVEMWVRRIELEIMRPLADIVQNTHPFFAERMTQLPDYATLQRQTAREKFAWLDREIAGRSYLTGDGFTMADIVGMSALSVAGFAEAEPGAELKNLQTWKERVSSRPSYQA